MKENTHVLSFGCWCLMTTPPASSAHVGTAYYMPPEMVRGEGYGPKVSTAPPKPHTYLPHAYFISQPSYPDHHQADVWSFGCMVWEMVTGRPPNYGSAGVG